MTARLRFGLAIDFGTDAEPLSARVEWAAGLLEKAEGYGFESVTAGEAYPTGGGYFHLPSPLLVLAALAGRTRMRIGTGVTLLPTWNVLRLAYDAAVLDELSGGRLFIGAAAGSAEVWHRFGVDGHDLGRRLDESVQALKALWRGEAGFDGEIVRVEGPIRPLPVQPGGPPIWLGGLVPRAARRAAELADGWYAPSNQRLDSIKAQATRYHQALGENGGRGVVVVNRFAAVDESDAEAHRWGGPAIEATLQKYAGLGGLRDDAGQTLGAGGPPLVPALDQQLLLLGSPDTVNDRIERYAAAGVTHLQLRVATGDVDPRLVERSVTLLGEHVLPRWVG